MDTAIVLLTLTAMEIVLGIDNIVFISIQAGKLPERQQALARTLGLGAALGTRVLLLLSLNWVLSLTTPLFHLTDIGISPHLLSLVQQTAGEHHEPAPEPPGADADAAPDDAAPAAAPAEGGDHVSDELNAISVRDLILVFGGLFLIRQSVTEIHHKVAGDSVEAMGIKTSRVSMGSVLLQIAILDIIFSLDSVITAVGMADEIWIMVMAVIIAVIVMMLFAGRISHFVHQYPTVKMLALSFLLLIGVLLVAEGIGTPINKGYIYFAMAFSLLVEGLNLKVAARRKAAEGEAPAGSVA